MLLENCGQTCPDLECIWRTRITIRNNSSPRESPRVSDASPHVCDMEQSEIEVPDKSMSPIRFQQRVEYYKDDRALS